MYPERLPCFLLVDRGGAGRGGAGRGGARLGEGYESSGESRNSGIWAESEFSIGARCSFGNFWANRGAVQGSGSGTKKQLSRYDMQVIAGNVAGNFIGLSFSGIRDT